MPPRTERNSRCVRSIVLVGSSDIYCLTTVACLSADKKESSKPARSIAEVETTGDESLKTLLPWHVVAIVHHDGAERIAGISAARLARILAKLGFFRGRGRRQVGVEDVGYYLPFAVGLLLPNLHELAMVRALDCLSDLSWSTDRPPQCRPDRPNEQPPLCSPARRWMFPDRAARPKWPGSPVCRWPSAR
jgi:hypothetical protein